MPQIPTYDGPQVQSRGLTFDQASPDAFGGIQGRQASAVGQAGAQMAEALDRINEREVQTQVFNAEAAAKNGYQQWSQEAIKNRQGVAAKGLTKDSADWWGKANETFGKDLSPMAQRMLQKSLTQQSLAASHSMGQYENAQGEAAQQLSLKATTQSSRDSAVLDSSDTNIALQRQNIIGAWSTQKTKMDPDTFNQVVKGELTQMHEAVFNKLFVDSPSQAKLYYEVNQKEIAGNVLDNMKARLKAGVADEIGGAGARDVFTQAMAGKGYNDAIPYDQMDAKLVEQFKGDPTTLKAARSELDRQVAMRNKTQTENQAGAIDAVYGLINKNTPLSTVMRTPQWDGLSEQSKRGIQQQVDDRNHMMWARSIEDKARLEHERQLRFAPAMFLYSQPENLAKMSRESIINLMPEIGYQNAQSLMQTWQGYQNDQTKLSRATVDNDQFKSVLAGAGIEPNPSHKDKEASKRWLDIRSQVEITIGQMQQGGKRELSPTEKQKVMQDVVYAKVLTPGTIYGFNPTPVYQTTPEELARSFVEVNTGVSDPKNAKPVTYRLPLSSIPAAEYAAVERQLRREGSGATPADVGQAWYDFTQKKKGLK